MIISRTPLRMSFVGGGSDLPAFYERFGGAVVSAAVDKYVYVTCNPKFDNGIRVAYSKTEEVDSPDKIEHKIVRATLELLRISGGVEITTVADIPSRGTGLGSSSAFAVGLLHVLHAFRGQYVSAAQLAEQSCHVEIDLCGEPIGKQDQYASAFGGLSLIEFQQDGGVRVTPLIVPPARRAELLGDLIVFYTGMTRSASYILQAQSDATAANADKQGALRRMVELSYVLKKELENGNVGSFGDILHENWLLKKSLTQGISSSQIDAWYDAALCHGARGGKLLGAGGGGFLLFHAPHDRHAAIEAALSPLRRVNFGFEPLGSRIIFYNPQ